MRTLILAAALVGLSGAAWAGPPCTVPNAAGSYNFDTCGNPVVNTGAPGSGGTVTAIPQVVTPSNGFANSQVTTGGTAVTAVTANGAPRGGTIYGPSSCSLCLDATTTAGTVTGTPQTTFCLATGQIWNVQSSTKLLSVNSATSACPINGYLN